MGLTVFQSVSRGIPSFGDLAYHAPVLWATDTVAFAGVTMAPATGYSFGQTLTANANGALSAETTMVGQSPAVGDRILVRGQGTPQNGIWVVTAVGDATHKWAMRRATDADSAAELPTGSMVIAMSWPTGDVTLFVQTPAGAWITVPQGLDAVIFAAALGSVIFQAGASIAGALTVGGSIAGIGDNTLSGSTTPTIAGGGTATFSARSCAWVKVGPLVVFRLTFTLSANGSGATTVTVTGTGLPTTANTCRITGDRGGVGVTPLFGRLQNASGEGQFTSMVTASAPTTSLTGADLVSGASYQFAGTYLNA